MKIGTGISSVYSQSVQTPSGPQANPDFTKLLLHLNSDFSDSSIHNRTPTLVGASPPVIDTEEKVFGSGAYKSTAIDQGITFPASTDFNFADNIPAQLSFRMFSATGRLGVETFIGTSNWVTPGWLLFSEAGWTALQLASNNGVRATWNYVFPKDVWTAHRVNHDGAGKYRWYVDGVLLGIRSSALVVDTLAYPMHVGGRHTWDDGITGNLDEVLFEKHADLVITTSSTYEVETSPYVDP